MMLSSKINVLLIMMHCTQGSVATGTLLITFHGCVEKMGRPEIPAKIPEIISGNVEKSRGK